MTAVRHWLDSPDFRVWLRRIDSAPGWLRNYYDMWFLADCTVGELFTILSTLEIRCMLGAYQQDRPQINVMRKSVRASRALWWPWRYSPMLCDSIEEAEQRELMMLHAQMQWDCYWI